MPALPEFSVALDLADSSSAGLHLEGQPPVTGVDGIYQFQLTPATYPVVLGSVRVTAGRFTVTDSGSGQLPQESTGFMKVQAPTLVKLTGFPVQGARAKMFSI